MPINKYTPPDYNRDEREAQESANRKENEWLYGQADCPIPTSYYGVRENGKIKVYRLDADCPAHILKLAGKERGR